MINIKELAERFLQSPQAAERYHKCVQCPRFDIPDGICKECGCLMVLKTFIPIASCPLNKW
jgi:hypothetical protein